MATNQYEPSGTGKQSETAVDLIPESLSETLNVLPDAVFTLNSDGLSVFANHAAVNLLGMPSDSLTGHPFRHLLDTGSLDEFDRFFDELILNGQNRFTLYMVHAEGHTITLDCSACKIVSHHPFDPLFIFSLRSATDETALALVNDDSDNDLTELKKTRDALRESEHMYKILTDNSMDIVCQVDLKGCYTYVSPSVESNLGYHPNQIIGQHALDFIHPEDRKNVIRLFTYGVTKGERQIRLAEFRFRSLNGTWRWFQTLGKPLTNRSGETYSILMSSRDITLRKRRDEELLKFVSLVENSSDFIGMSDMDQHLIYMNPSGCELLGIRTADHILGKPLKELYTPDGAELFRGEAFPKVLKDGFWTGETTMMNQVTGEPIAVRQTLHLVMDTQTGKPVCIATILQDIRERLRYIEDLKSAKERAELADRAKSEFLANISHEIRTPLNGILGFADLLGSNIENPGNRRYLDNIRSSGQNLLQLINDILDLSKIESGRIELQHDTVDIHGLLREVESIFSLQLLQKRITFRAEVDADMPRKLILDEIRIRQILLNLIGNAIKFTGQGYVRVKVRAGSYPAGKKTIHLSISVEDTGIGIDPSQQQLIFDSFRQQSGQSNRKYGGTGLGLTITKRLTEKMGGTIAVASTPGKGSTFTIRIPDVEYIPDRAAGRKQASASAAPPDVVTESHDKTPGRPNRDSETSDEGPGRASDGNGDQQLDVRPAGGLKKNRKSADDNDPNLSEELIRRLVHLYENDWESLRNTLIMSNARTFGRKLEDLGISSRNRMISSYAAQLLDQVETFDVERLPDTIHHFEKIYLHIKQKASN